MDFIVLNGIRYTLPELEAWLWTLLVEAHFAIVETRVGSMDWLLLGRDGHRRAIFDYQNQSMNARWVTP